MTKLNQFLPPLFCQQFFFSFILSACEINQLGLKFNYSFCSFTAVYCSIRLLAFSLNEYAIFCSILMRMLDVDNFILGHNLHLNSITIQQQQIPEEVLNLQATILNSSSKLPNTTPIVTRIIFALQYINYLLEDMSAANRLDFEHVLAVNYDYDVIITSRLKV